MFINQKTALFSFEMKYNPIATEIESIPEFERNIFKAAEYLVEAYRVTAEKAQCERLNVLLRTIREENKGPPRRGPTLGPKAQKAGEKV
jgi:hypothetical protein